METNQDFNIGNFITDSLCLHTNINPTARLLEISRSQNPYEKYFNHEPIDLLGEKPFVESVKVPEDVIGTEVQEFYRGAHILITGGTGFLGKLLTEKLIRSMPHLGHIYLMIRDKRGRSAQDRFEKLLEDKVFRRMREEVPWYLTKMTVVTGDLRLSGLGLSDVDRQVLTDKVHVVFHVAADVKFTEPLNVAVETNVTGAERVVELAAQMAQLKAIVHVSTAYSQSVRKVIPESIPRMNLPFKDILNHIQKDGYGPEDSKTIRLMQGWPNTYSFSKALGEIMLEEQYHHLPISIFRPSVIFPTYKEPTRGWTDNLYGPMANMVAVGMGVMHIFPTYKEPTRGWTDNLYGPMANMVAVGMGVMHSYRCDLGSSVDIVPGDYVANAMIVVAMDTANNRRAHDIKVFNYTTISPQRPRSWKHIFAIGAECVKKWPFSNAIWYLSYNCQMNYAVCVFKHVMLHKIPAWVIDKLLILWGRKPRLMDIWRRVDIIQPSMDYFTFTCFEFKNTNISDLWSSLGDKDKALFNFDTRAYDTVESTIVSYAGIKYYLFKDMDTPLPAVRNRYKRLYWIHNAVKLLWWFGMLCLSVRLARVLPL